LFIATDANPDALLETAWKAARKPARGGISNLICIAEPLNVLASEFESVADRITVILPWGKLLRAVAIPEIDSLQHIARLTTCNASVEIVFSYDAPQVVRANAPHLYEQAGLQITSLEKIPQRELVAYETTWAKRLAFGKPREVWRIRANALVTSQSTP